MFSCNPPCCLRSDPLEELCQLFIEQGGHGRRLHLGEFAEERQLIVHVDTSLLAVPRRNADAHWSAQPGGPAVLEQATCDDSVPDEVELRLDGNARQAHCGALLEIPKDGKKLGS